MRHNSTQLALKAFALWSGILLLAIGNGTLREFLLLPAFGVLPAYLLSGLLLAAMILAVAYLTLPWLGTHRPSQRWAVGLGWLALTLMFEISFGLWRGETRSTLLAAYSFEEGNLWPVVLATILTAPTLAAVLRERR